VRVVWKPFTAEDAENAEKKRFLDADGRWYGLIWTDGLLFLADGWQLFEKHPSWCEKEAKRKSLTTDGHG